MTRTELRRRFPLAGPLGVRSALLLVAGLTVAASAPLEAQVPFDRGVAGTALSLRHLDGVKRVLMIGAHPDDEDTALLTALARGMGAETAYLSLTRGDGGQNLIGPELGEGLGVVRTGELMAARALDGGGQFFTRAFDFGYSKTAEEALRLWHQDELLRDVVWVIRNYRPQVIVSVWTGTTADGHGQHQASGIIAADAFEAAADPSLFPEMAGLGAPAWQADKYYERRRGQGQEGIQTSVPTGTYDPVLGRSHLQLAMDSRSQHRSQDMGAGQPFGSRDSQLVLTNRAPGLNVPGDEFFAGVDTSFVAVSQSITGGAQRVVAGHLSGYRDEIARAAGALSPVDPSAVLAPLQAARSHLVAALTAAADAPADHPAVRTMRERLADLDQTILQAAGIVVRVRAEDDLIVPGEPAAVVVELWNGGAETLRFAQSSLDLPAGWDATLAGTDGDGVESEGSNPGYRVGPGAVMRWEWTVDVPADADVSRLYFRAEERDGEMYRWPNDPALWGLPRDPSPIHGTAWFMPNGPEGVVPAEWTMAGSIATLNARRPARYVGVDKAKGEFTKPLLVVPAVSVSTTPSSLVWPLGANATKQVSVEVSGEALAGARGAVSLDVPAGWSVSPSAHDFAFDGPAQSRTFTFDVQPAGAGAGSHVFTAVARLSDGREYREGFRLLDYEHIERTAMFDPARTGVTVVPVRVAEGRIGYIQGSGDDGLLALQQMGADAELVTIDQLRAGELSQYDVLVLGIRVYETRPDVAAVNDQILDFARQGGTVVVQYNKYEYPAGNFAPYAVEMGRPNSRTTDETSPVEFLNPDSPVFNTPNQIGMEDFEGWVQERGLYFLTEWEAPFEPVIAFTDPGEEPQDGSIVIAPVGEGLYVYTGLSFFRQFPAGVAGAYRLFANLVSLRAEDVAR